MRHVRKYIEITPQDIDQYTVEYGPVCNVRLFREKLFEWFYLANSVNGEWMVMIGPYPFRWMAAKAWRQILIRHEEWEESRTLDEAVRLENERLAKEEAYRLEAYYPEDAPFSRSYIGPGRPADGRYRQTVDDGRYEQGDFSNRLGAGK